MNTANNAESQYQGSEAFNQLLNANESVNPGTGSLSLSISVARLSGIYENIGFALNLIYTHGRKGTFGLPQNWAFNLPFMIPGQSLSWAGSTYSIDRDWAAEDGYQSGLRYFNDHSVLFTEKIGGKLPDNKTAYSYELRDDEGKIFYFDATGKLIYLRDRFSNSLSYSYVDNTAGPVGNLMDSVTDSFGQVVKFSYQPGSEILVTLPHKEKIKISYSDRGIHSVTDCLGHRSLFNYTTFESSPILESALYPTGLLTKIRYEKMPYLRSDGKTAAFPRVTDFIHEDSANANRLLEHNHYLYGRQTSNTYTGYSLGCKLSNTSDALMDSGNLTYRYDVCTKKLDADGNTLMATSTTFNYLHATTEIEFHLIDKSATLKPGRRTLNDYPSTKLEQARTYNATKPIKSTSQEWSADSNNYLTTHRIENQYDLFGNITETRSYNKDEPHPQVTKSTAYALTKWGGELVQTITLFDAITGNTERQNYILNDDETAVLSHATETRKNPTDPWTPWKTTTYEYDEQGRILAETLTFSEKTTSPDIGPKQATNRYRFDYDKTSHCLTTTTINALEVETSIKQDMRYSPAVIVEETNALGASSTNQYDALGRIIKTTDVIGGITQYQYQLVQTDNINSVIIESPGGYCTQICSDAIGRTLQTRDSGNNTNNDGKCTRILSENVYDDKGALIKEINQLQLVTLYEYDALQRLIKHSDPHGNSAVTHYSPLSTTLSINGKIRQKDILDGFGRVIRKEIFSVNSTGEIAEKIITNTTHDSHGNIISVEKRVSPAGSSEENIVSKMDNRYDADGKLIYVATQGYGDLPAETILTKKLDLLGNITTESRSVSYVDGRQYESSSDTYVYNILGQLESRKNALGQIESYYYDAASNLIEKRLFDGSSIGYTYTPDNLTQTVIYTDGKEQHTYNSHRQTVSISLNEQTMHTEYQHDGSLLKQQYPDGSCQAFRYNNNGQLIGIVNAIGKTTVISYNAEGQIAEKTCDTETLRYTYGEINGKKGMLTLLDMHGSQHLRQLYSYNAYDDLNQVVVEDSESNAQLLKSEQTFNPLQQLTENSLATDSISYHQKFVYDGLGQIATEITTSEDNVQATRFEYDGNGNVISKSTQQQDLELHQEKFTYNAIDQLITENITYDLNGRLLANGNRKYSYDAKDQLVSVTQADKTVAYTYYPNGLLAKRETVIDTETMYYLNGSINVRGSRNTGFNSILAGPTGPGILLQDAGITDYIVSAFGSVIADIQGDTIQPQIYGSYGEPKENPTVSGLCFGWKNESYDIDSELVYLRARYYDPRTMRFLTADTYPVANRYNFGFADPVNQFDPSGHYSSSGIALNIAGIVLGIGSAVAAPFTGTSSLVVTGVVVGGVLGATSSAAALVSDASKNGNKSAETAATILGIAGFVADIASAAVLVKAWRQPISRATRETRRALQRGIAFVGEFHDQHRFTEELFNRLTNTPFRRSPVRGVAIEAANQVAGGEHPLNTINLANTQFFHLNAVSTRRSIPVLFHDLVDLPLTEPIYDVAAELSGMGFRNIASVQHLEHFIDTTLNGNVQGLFVHGGAYHFTTPQHFAGLPYNPIPQLLDRGPYEVINLPDFY